MAIKMRHIFSALVFGLAVLISTSGVQAQSGNKAQVEDEAQPSEPILTEAEQATVRTAQDWLESVKTLKARFVQVGAGGQAEGVMLLKRPGLIRFDYAPPAKVLLVSDGTFVSFVDYEVGQLSQWPLFDTPLSYLVRKELNLMGEADIDQVRDRNGEVSFRLRDPTNPEQGTITLQFAKVPYRLLGWQIIDAQGQETAVALADLDINVDLPLGSFTFRTPTRPWQNEK